MKKNLTMFRSRIRSRHPSHDYLRPINKTLPLLPFKSVIRFGSTTDMKDTIANGGNRIELNTIEAIKNSSNKLLMKQCFTNSNVKTADWYKIQLVDGFIECFPQHNNDEGEYYTCDFEELPYPIISKHIFGSRGTGNKKHDNQESLEAWMEGKDLSKYIFEKFYNYNREYRLHVTENGCFYTCRKMLKNDAPKEKRWYRNDQYCVWIKEENELFDKPLNWKEIVKESVKALKSIGLDFGAIDLRIQSSKDKKGNIRKKPKFIIVEINSAPSFGDVTKVKYQEIIPEILKLKHERTS